MKVMVMWCSSSQLMRVVGVVAGVVVDGVHAGAAGEVGPQFPDGGVEADGGDLGGPVGGGGVVGGGVPVAQVGEAVVFDLDAFGFAGGS